MRASPARVNFPEETALFKGPRQPRDGKKSWQRKTIKFSNSRQGQVKGDCIEAIFGGRGGGEEGARARRRIRNFPSVSEVGRGGEGLPPSRAARWFTLANFAQLSPVRGLSVAGILPSGDPQPCRILSGGLPACIRRLDAREILKFDDSMLKRKAK